MHVLTLRELGDLESARTMDMKASGLSVAAIGFAILVIAIDFAVIRAAFLSPGSKGWGEPGVRLLPHVLADSIFGPGLKGWAVFAFCLLPVIDALLIGVYRLRRRGDHTAKTAGYVIAGSVATLAVFTSCLIWPGSAIGLTMPISRRIALASFHGLARLFGNAPLPTHAMEWAYAVIFAVLIPIAFFCIPPLLVAVIGGRLARNFWPSRPTMGAGQGETMRGVETPNADHSLDYHHRVLHPPNHGRLSREGGDP
jgi:hypothetical protein